VPWSPLIWEWPRHRGTGADCAGYSRPNPPHYLDHHPLMKIDVLSSQAQHLTWASD
jgi:hypothetical protein